MNRIATLLAGIQSNVNRTLSAITEAYQYSELDSPEAEKEEVSYLPKPAIKAKQSTDPAELAKLARHKNEFVRIETAKNPHTPDHVIDHMTNNEHSLHVVSAGLAKHPKLSAQHIHQILVNPHHRDYSDTFNNFAHHKHIHPKTLHLVAQQLIKERTDDLNNPDREPNRSHHETHQLLLSHPKTSKETKALLKSHFK